MLDRTAQKKKKGNTEIFRKKSNPKAHIIRFTRVEMKEKMLRAAREKDQLPHNGKPIRLTADLSAQTIRARRVGANIQHL